MSDFKPFGKAVADQFKQMSTNELFVVDVSGDDLYAEYLAAFPEGTNPVYKTKTEHECSCCKNFIRNLGNVVSVAGGKIESVWSVDLSKLPNPYNVVADRLNTIISKAKVVSLFRSSEPQYGTESSKQYLPDGTVHTWNHFYGKVAAKHFTKDVGTIVGDYNTKVQVFKRGLEELDVGAIKEVLGLIDSNSIYRGAEFKGLVESYFTTIKAYRKLDTKAKNLFVWQNAVGALAGFRNTVIGTLVQDLTEGKPLEAAVASYEAKVAPTNYKRPTALITPSMVASAMKTIKELDIEDSLQRRYAVITDVSVNNVLWVDGSVKQQMKGVEDLLMQTAKKSAAVTSKTTLEVSMEDFVSKVLPKATDLELFVSNNLQPNFMSLTAPVYPDAKNIFKWHNNFAWSYDGNITDSLIKEKVAKAGGNTTTAKLRISLAWFNKDDLDIHVHTPRREHIYYCNKMGCLDVDMNAGYGYTRTPVENVSFTSTVDGVYQVAVNQFSCRESSDVGFTLEVENNKIITQYSYNKRVSGMNNVLSITVKNGLIVDIKADKSLTGGGFTQEKWGVQTEQFVKVNTLMLSPNYWDDNAVGNKHWFFVLDGCKNNEGTRGIYNEFLSSDLDKHRKVFEVLGDKTKCESSDNQLSGIGLSSTRNDVVTAKVNGRLYKVVCS